MRIPLLSLIVSMLVAAPSIVFAVPSQDSAPTSPAKGWRTGVGVDAPTLEESGTKMIQGLAVCGFVLCVGVWGYKRYILKAPTVISRKMKIIERMPLSPRSTLVLIEVEGKKKLVAMGSDPVSFHDLAESESFSFDSLEHNKPTERECDTETSVT